MNTELLFQSFEDNAQTFSDQELEPRLWSMYLIGNNPDQDAALALAGHYVAASPFDEDDDLLGLA